MLPLCAVLVLCTSHRAVLTAAASSQSLSHGQPDNVEEPAPPTKTTKRPAEINQNVLFQVRASVTIQLLSNDHSATASSDSVASFDPQWIDDSKSYILTIDELDDNDEASPGHSSSGLFQMEQPLKLPWELLSLNHTSSSPMMVRGETTLAMLFPLERSHNTPTVRTVVVTLWEDDIFLDNDDDDDDKPPTLLTRRLANMPRKVMEFKSRQSKLVPVELHASGPFLKVQVEAFTTFSLATVEGRSSTNPYHSEKSKQNTSRLWSMYIYGCTAIFAWLWFGLSRRKASPRLQNDDSQQQNNGVVTGAASEEEGDFPFLELDEDDDDNNDEEDSEEEDHHALAEKEQLSYEGDSSSSSSDCESTCKIVRPPMVLRDSPEQSVPKDLVFLSRPGGTASSNSKRAIWKRDREDTVGCPVDIYSAAFSLSTTASRTEAPDGFVTVPKPPELPSDSSKSREDNNNEPMTCDRETAKVVDATVAGMVETEARESKPPSLPSKSRKDDESIISVTVAAADAGTIEREDHDAEPPFLPSKSREDNKEPPMISGCETAKVVAAVADADAETGTVETEGHKAVEQKQLHDAPKARSRVVDHAPAPTRGYDAGMSDDTSTIRGGQAADADADATDGDGDEASQTSNEKPNFAISNKQSDDTSTIRGVQADDASDAVDGDGDEASQTSYYEKQNCVVANKQSEEEGSNIACVSTKQTICDTEIEIDNSAVQAALLKQRPEQARHDATKPKRRRGDRSVPEGDNNWLRRLKKRGATHLNQSATPGNSSSLEEDQSSPDLGLFKNASSFSPTWTAAAAARIDHQPASSGDGEVELPGAETDFGYAQNSESPLDEVKRRVTPSTECSRKRPSSSQSDTVDTSKESIRKGKKRQKRRKRRSLASAEQLLLPGVGPSKSLNSAAESVMSQYWEYGRHKSSSKSQKKSAPGLAG